MEAELLSETIAQGESASVEFKRCGAQPGQDTFEAICAFANHMGGSVYLGVEDNGTVAGVAEGAAMDMQRNIANVARNPKLFDPAVMLETEAISVNGKTVVRIWVPMSPDVHRYKGVVYDRIADADVRVSAGSQISAMYIRKSDLETERRIFPYLALSDLRADLIDRARQMALSFVFCGVANTLSLYCTATGNGRVLMVATYLRQLIVPLSALRADYGHGGGILGVPCLRCG